MGEEKIVHRKNSREKKCTKFIREKHSAQKN